MKFGCCTTIEYYQTLKQLGFDFIELSGRSITALDDQSFGRICQLLNDEKLPCLGLNAYCPPEIVIAGPGFDLKKAQNYAAHCAKRAATMGVMKVGIGSPNSRNLPEGFGRKRALAQAADFFKATAEQFEKFGIVVCIEALGICYCNFINQTAEALELVQKIRSPHVKLVLDFYNMEHSGEGDREITQIFPYIEHVHISDDDGSPSRRYFLKEEKFQIHKERLKRLQQGGYNKTIAIEIDLPVNEVLAKQSLDWIKRAVKAS